MHFMSLFSKVGVLLVLSVASVVAAELDDKLVGHWRLTHDCRDSSGWGNHGDNKGVTFTDASAVFDGIDDHIEVPDSPSLKFGTVDSTITVWVHTKAHLQDVIGNVLSKFDPATRIGLNLSVMNYVGATSAQSNHRNVFFGIDGGQAQSEWVDCGRPGNNNMIWALTVHDGNLYAGTWQPAEGDAGHVYRYEGSGQWADCGSPDRCNTVSTLAEHDGKLYAGGSFYSGRGSAQPISPNKNPGGRVFRYEGEDRWIDCGKIGDDVYTVTGLVTFDGQLYATTCDSYGCPTRTEACFRYEGDQKWTFVGNPGGRLGAFLVHNGSLYATVFGKQGFARYEGEAAWQPLGVVPNTGQTYSAVIYQGRICLGTWPTGTVFQFDGPNRFSSLGRLGEEKEVMAMAVYNGKLYSGTLPLGKVFRHDGPAGWTDTGQLDTTPDVLYRRVWSMAVYRGKLFAGTLPSGRVYSLEAGKGVSHDRSLLPGWQHLAAVKSGEMLRLYINGALVAKSTRFDASACNLANRQPLLLGFGQHDYFNGKMRDLRIYRRALSDSELNTLVSTSR
ncbi:MAG: LamG domain-containing protein [Pirellulaceae bacterium]|nr:LamG domain-containing protein [Pirellulaceae bacterium]MDP7302723.1 LamG domain-containing protein [Pirellulaceae bacterium]